MKIKITENDVKKQIMQGLEYQGWKVWRINNAGIYSKKTNGYYFHGSAGISDLLAIKNDKMLFIECKRPKGKLSGLQIGFLNAVNGVKIIKAFKAECFADCLTEITRLNNFNN